MIIIFLLLSFVLEGLISNLIPLNSIFIPFFSVVALLVIYPLFNGDKNKYVIVAGLYGLLYDIVYTNCPFINTITFILVSLMVVLIYNYITVNNINFSFINILIILFYQAISYILLCLFKYTTFNDSTFITSLYSSLISNIIYGIIIYTIYNFLIKKYRLRTLK